MSDVAVDLASVSSLKSTQTSVYKYYDAHGILIYVGITDGGIRRNREHNATKEWWPFVVSQQVEHCGSRQDALGRERSLILKFRPCFNKQHNPEHQILRAAYLALRQHSGAEKSLRDWQPSKARKQTELMGLIERARFGWFSTNLTDALAMKNLRFSPNVKLCLPQGFPVGKVVGIKHTGPFARIHVATLKHCREKVLRASHADLIRREVKARPGFPDYFLKMVWVTDAADSLDAARKATVFLGENPMSGGK